MYGICDRVTSGSHPASPAASPRASACTPFSRRQLEETGLTPGWRCLEVGRGGGSLGERLRADGVTDEELTRFYALLRDPAFAVNSYPLISTRGRRR
ncbi:hypothetical protein [Streptomyces sp. PSKA30]|uniref:hypothetical protein n=1 Tax=Streptomyces sp. PSKA30 TaxID=2874597 RepID=UPI001CD051CD|nr:hypothetical protein [Streptomyces sp. PSKA30]MBZ9645733.1 hypothetical protein [Streptomyces sp. PSKA30]